MFPEVERFVAFAQMLPEPMALVSAEGRILAANGRLLALLERSEASVVGRSVADFCREPASELAAYLKAASRTREFLIGRATLQGGSDGPVHVRLEGGVLQPGSSGAPAVLLLRLNRHDVSSTRFVALTAKIDELNREIRRRIHVEADLRDQREWLHTTLSSIGDGVIATDGAGAVVFMNHVACDLTGWAADEARGRPITDVFAVVHEDTHAQVEHPVLAVIQQGAPVGLAGSSLLVRRDGRETPIDDIAAPIRGAYGELLGVVLVFRDVEQRRTLEREERAAREALEQASRAKDEFLTTLSHELRTPMNAILGWLQMIALGAVPRERLDDALRVVFRNAELQAKLIEDLLDVSRALTGRLEIQREPLQVHAVVAMALDMVRVAAVEKGVDLLERGPAADAVVLGDRQRLLQILTNLLSNAVKFTARGGRVEVWTELSAGQVHVGVTDTGEGIDPSFLPRVFDRFSQYDNTITRNAGGLGIGLAIAQTLARLHGGTLTASSEGRGHGATFVLTLPRAS